MRDELGRNRSRTTYYWRDLASLVLAATSSRPAAPELRAALDRIADDARWLRQHVPDYTPDGVATLSDLAREIEREAQAALASSPATEGAS